MYHVQRLNNNCYRQARYFSSSSRTEKSAWIWKSIWCTDKTEFMKVYNVNYWDTKNPYNIRSPDHQHEIKVSKYIFTSYPKSFVSVCRFNRAELLTSRDLTIYIFNFEINNKARCMKFLWYLRKICCVYIFLSLSTRI